jgi:hypothetical protein
MRAPKSQQFLHYVEREQKVHGGVGSNIIPKTQQLSKTIYMYVKRVAHMVIELSLPYASKEGGNNDTT